MHTPPTRAMLALTPMLLLTLCPPHAVAAAQPADPAPEVPEPPEPPSIPDALARGVRIILEMQEGDQKGEWPYEGVYRVRGSIPIGYRVGGTAIAAMALVQAPGFADDPERREAVARAAAFVAGGIAHPLMSIDEYDAGYDVRGWGYAYGLELLLRLKAAGLLAEGSEEKAEEAIRFYLDGLQRTQIPQSGGWNYARPPGADQPAPPSPFMTAATLQTLFRAEAMGYDVDETCVRSGLDALERARTPAGVVVYAGAAGSRTSDRTPGAVGRMLITETTLHLAGRGSVAAIRGALDAFIVHWSWLDKRRAQQGTHVAPYGIAPYYFYFAHHAAAQAVEMLPAAEREEYRRRINDLLFSVRLPDGGWNDRVFPRSANYGTAMAILALTMPDAAPPPRWRPAEPVPDTN